MQPTTIDVLLFTLKYLSSKEALRISTVCKDIHVVVIHMVLSRGIRLGYPQQLFRFPYFITADSSTRIPFLRGLYMHSRAIPHWSQLLMTTTDQSALAPPNNFAFFLTQILIRSTYLRSLSLNASEFLLTRHPTLREALIQYRGLVELSLTDVTEDVLRVVRAMRSNIRVLSLSHPISRGIRLPGTLQYIATHAHLEKLRFTATSGDRSVWNFSTTIQWPAVRELRVYGIVSLDLLVAAFPNVRSLHVDEIGIDHPVPSAQWSSLDFLHGQLLLLQSWQIQCPVRRLDLCLDEWVFDCFTPINYTDTAAQLVSLMERTTPMILSFDVGYNAPLEFWETVAPAMHSVKLLELSVWFDVFDREKWENDERAKSERNEMSEDEEDEGAMDVDEEDDDSAMDDDDDDGSGDDGNGDDGHGDYDKEGLKVEFKEFLLARAAEWIATVPPYIGKLPVPCLWISFVQQWDFPSLSKRELREALINALKDVQDVLVGSMPYLQYVAISFRGDPYYVWIPMIKENIKRFRDERTWWKTSWREGEQGGRAVAIPIPRQQGEEIRTYLLTTFGTDDCVVIPTEYDDKELLAAMNDAEYSED